MFMGHEAFPENNERLARQNQTEIRVIVGNPPYSVGQDNANDNNQNLAYPILDQRIRETYAAYSTAVNKNSLYDSYIRAFRWASDRMGQHGVIGFVTNAGWIDGNTMDGFRQVLQEEFTDLYVFHLRGNQRTSGELSRKEGGKIFGSGSRAPIAITILVKNPSKRDRSAAIHFHDIGDYLSREAKLAKVAQAASIPGVEWQEIQPNEQHDWVNQRSDAFDGLIPLGDKTASPNPRTIFSIYSRGVATSRDAWSYNFKHEAVVENMRSMIDVYNNQVERLNNDPNDNMTIDANPKHISWSRGLKNDLNKRKVHIFRPSNTVLAVYRPFVKQWLYLDRAFNDMVYRIPSLYPAQDVKRVKNVVISVNGTGVNKDFSCLVTEAVPDIQLHANGQCFPLYYYEEVSLTPPSEQARFAFDEGESPHSQWIRHEAITDWALQECRVRYGPSVIKEDIFYYVYGLLHSPDYRTRFAADLKKMLPRIPFVESQDDFSSFSRSGRELAHWHLDYESVEPWGLTEITTNATADVSAFYRIQKMRWGKNDDGSVDKTTIIYNEFLTLYGIPLEAYDYIVNGKSALEWVMERYQVKIDKDSGILNDPNEWSDDPRYIVDLVNRVVQVSMQTLRIVEGLPKLKFDETHLEVN
jgi:predicted helicase